MNVDLIKKIIRFRDERDWGQFHTIKDLCLGIGIEVSELQEIFLWKTNDEMESIKVSEKDKIENELGWEAKTSLEEGLKKTIDWYIANK